MLNQKIRIAVRMPDKSRRLYTVDDVGMSPDEMRAATMAEVPTAAAVLVECPAPISILEGRAA